MEERNVDFEIPLTDEQWSQLGQRADALGPDEGGFAWDREHPERIHVYLRDEEARGLWSDYVSEEGFYGEDRREMAQFVFNGGRPYAHLESPTTADEPAILSQEEDAMEVGLERWVRDKWHRLLRESGIHFDRGHIPTDVE